MAIKRLVDSTWSHELCLSENPALESLGCLLEGGSKFMIEAPEATRAYAVIDRNRQLVRYYWHINSSTLPELMEECKTHGFPTNAPSWSRLCKHVFINEIGEGTSGIRIHPFYKGLAEQKWHWHCTRAIPGYFENVSEIDIKSAYAQSILNQPTMYRESRHACRPDNGMMERWREVYPKLSKKLRLAMVGWLSSNMMSTLVPPKPGEMMLQRKIIYKCYDGGIFNTIHEGLYSLYGMMTQLAHISLQHVPRVHTDSFWVTGDIPNNKLEAMLDLIEDKGYQCSIKGHGDAVIFDLNSAILGGHIIGIPSIAAKQFEKFCKQNPQIDWSVKDLDPRLRHLPYKNERLSLRQHQQINAMLGIDS